MRHHKLLEEYIYNTPLIFTLKASRYGNFSQPM